MKKTKALFILHLPPPVHGPAMVSQSIKVSKKINHFFDISFVNLSTSRNVDEIGRSSIIKIIRYFSIICNVTFQLFSKKPSFVYITLSSVGLGFYKDVIIASIAKLFNFKLVIHLHNKGVKTQQHMFLNNIFYKWIFRNSKIILLSKLLYDDVSKYVNKSDVFYCPNGIDNIKNETYAEKKNNKIVTLLFLSNLIKSKGVFDLLKALKKLKNKNIDFKCNFVGDIGDINKKDFNQKLVDFKLDDNVKYQGKKFSEEKLKFLEKSDIFIHPTHNDCLPLVILEAFRSKLPVISTNEGAIPEIIDQGLNGFIVKKHNIDELAEKIEILIKNVNLRESMSKEAYNKFNRDYTLQRFEQNFITILSSLN